MDIIYEIRRRHLVQKQSIAAIAREMKISRPTLRKFLNAVKEPKCERVQPISQKLGAFESYLTHWLEEEAKLPRFRRRTAHRLYEGLQGMGYDDASASFARENMLCWGSYCCLYQPSSRRNNVENHCLHWASIASQHREVE